MTMSVLAGSDSGLVAIGARFGVGASVGAGIGEGAAAAAADGAGLARRACRRPIRPFMLPPGLLPAVSIGSYLDLPDQFGPPTGWFWDITSLTINGPSTGTVAVAKNAPAITPGGGAYAVELVAVLTAETPAFFPRKGMPLLDASERLVFTVVSALGSIGSVTGSVVSVPAERIDEYMS